MKLFRKTPGEVRAVVKAAPQPPKPLPTPHHCNTDRWRFDVEYYPTEPDHRPRAGWFVRVEGENKGYWENKLFWGATREAAIHNAMEWVNKQCFCPPPPPDELLYVPATGDLSQFDPTTWQDDDDDWGDDTAQDIAQRIIDGYPMLQEVPELSEALETLRRFATGQLIENEEPLDAAYERGSHWEEGDE